MSGGRGSTVRRAFDLLGAVARSDGSVTVTEIARTVGLPAASAQRLVEQLLAEGLLRRDSRRLSVGPAALGFARAIIAGVTPEDLAQPLMDALRAELGETITLNRYDPADGILVCVAVSETPKRLRYSLDLGETRNLNMGAGGKAALAFLPEVERDRLLDEHGLPQATPRTITDRATLLAELDAVRLAGVAVSNGESVTGAVGFAAPVFCAPGRLYGSLAVVLPEIRYRAADRDRWCLALRDAAGRMTDLLSGGEDPPRPAARTLTPDRTGSR